MKNKSIYVSAIIRTVIIFTLLLIIISKNQDMLFKIMIIPFLFCSLFSVAKNICLIINKKKLATIFSKLFVITFLMFWFGILIFWSINVIKNNNYFSLIFTVPFWLAGIYIFCKFLLRLNLKFVFKQKKLNFNFKIVISGFLVLSVLIIGIVCLAFGISDTYILNKKTKGYLTTDGYLKDYSIYSTDKDGTTYKLIYTYEIDGIEYSITTDYGVGAEFIPKINSKRKIRYNQTNPTEAILVGINSSNFLIYFGTFFTLGGSIFVLALLYIKGIFDNVKINVMGAYMGVVCIIIGVGILLFQNITISSLFTINSFKIWIMIPILFIISGIYLTIKSLLWKNKKMYK